jgi:hypothetical protein
VRCREEHSLAIVQRVRPSVMDPRIIIVYNVKEILVHHGDKLHRDCFIYSYVLTALLVMDPLTIMCIMWRRRQVAQGIFHIFLRFDCLSTHGADPLLKSMTSKKTMDILHVYVLQSWSVLPSLLQPSKRCIVVRNRDNVASIYTQKGYEHHTSRIRRVHAV